MIAPFSTVSVFHSPVSIINYCYFQYDITIPVRSSAVCVDLRSKNDGSLCYYFSFFCLIALHRPSIITAMNFGSPCPSISCSSSPSDTILHIGCIVGKCNGQLPKDNSNSINMPSPLSPSNVNSSVELMNEIATLEVKILQLERHLLSLYRDAFQHKFPALLGNNHGFKDKTFTNHQNVKDIQNGEGCLKMALFDLSHDYQIFPLAAVPRLNDPIQSELRLSSSKERQKVVSSRVSLADYLGTSQVYDYDIHNYPDKLSREILRCICSIYCKFSNPAHSQRGLSVSSASSLSSSSTFSSVCSSSPRVHVDEPTCHVNLDNLNSDTVEVLKIGLDDDTFQYASRMLQHFRSLVESLEKVDPRKMKREEKLAFWINIHNSLVMHAYLAYGTYGSVRSPSVLKAAYNVGGVCVKAYEIQSSVLGIQSHYSTPWLKSLLSPRKRFMPGSGGEQHPYAIEYLEPLVHFALASGTFSDPVVRVYTAENVFCKLKAAKDEFIRSNISVEKSSKKVYLPKILGYYSRDMGLGMSEVLEIVCRCLPEFQKDVVRTCIKRRGHEKQACCWATQSLSFRYLIHKDVVRGV